MSPAAYPLQYNTAEAALGERMLTACEKLCLEGHKNVFFFCKRGKRKETFPFDHCFKISWTQQWCLFLGNALGVAWRGSE